MFSIPYETESRGILMITPCSDGKRCRVTDSAGKCLVAGERLRAITPYEKRAWAGKVDTEKYTHIIGKLVIDGGSVAGIEGMLNLYNFEQDMLAWKIVPEGFTYEIGCDCGDKYGFVLPAGTPYELYERRLDLHEGLELVKQHITKKELREKGEAVGAEVIESNLSTYGGWKFSMDVYEEFLVLARSRAKALEAGRAAARAQLMGIEIPVEAKNAYDRYHGDSDKAWADEDESAWALIRRYGDAIEAQHGMDAVKMGEKLAECSREANFGIQEG